MVREETPNGPDEVRGETKYEMNIGEKMILDNLFNSILVTKRKFK